MGFETKTRNFLVFISIISLSSLNPIVKAQKTFENNQALITGYSSNEEIQESTVYSSLETPSSSDDSSIQSVSSSSFESGSGDSVDEEDLELVQMFAFARHGISTQGYFLYEKEYAAYKILDNGDGIEKLTPLGAAQCWSMGRNWASKYSEFFSDSILNDSFLFNVVKQLKNKKCANYIWFGIQNYVPFIGFFSDDLVQEAFLHHGNCQKCFSDSRFPFEFSQSHFQTFSDGVAMNQALTTQNIEEHPYNFLNLKNNCKTIYKFLCTEVEGLPKKDVKILKKECSNLRARWDNYSAIQTLHKHLYHNLPMEGELANLSETTVNRALRMKDSTTDCLIKSVLNVHESKWTLPALFTRGILEDLIKKMRSKETSLNVYVVHDLNLQGLLAFLHGARNDLGDFITFYASQSEILIYKDTTREKYYVKLFYNGEEFQIRGCGDDYCELSELLELMTGYLELGGDLKEFCQA